MQGIKIFLFFVLFSISLENFSQRSVSEGQKLADICRIWGYLKYFHPEVAKGKLDWDHELIGIIQKTENIKDQKTLNKIYLDWIEGIGKVKLSKKKIAKDSSNYFSANAEFSWLEDTAELGLAVINRLKNIQNSRIKTNYYVKSTKWKFISFEKEKPYPDSVYPAYQFRLLSLFRYWNIVNYFYPYKYLIGEKWDAVLNEMIPRFRYAGDTTSYHLAMLELTVKINDGHAGFSTPCTNRFFGLKWVPFKFMVIENKAIVIGSWNDSLSKIDDVRYGDVFLTVDGKSIHQILKEKARYINGSNEASKISNSYYAIFNGTNDSLLVTFDRNGETKSKMIKRYLFKDLNYSPGNTKKQHKIIDGNIGYVNLGVLKKDQVADVLEPYLKLDAIIFDIRNYPKGTLYKISNYLNKERKPFARFTLPDISNPGFFSYSKIYKCGRHNENYYKGKVILLIDETTISHAEFTCMALQTAENVTCIGSSTAGADGNIELLVFPGDYGTTITGLGVYYPDWRPTQRTGIIPDVIVKPTIAGVRNKTDEVLLRAIEFAKTGK